MSAIELTAFTKANGLLTKRISLTPDGSVKSDGSACVMARGTARRLPIADIGELAAVIEKIRPEQAIALGALRAGLPDKVEIVTNQNLNGQAGVIARTAADIRFRKQEPALALLDFDAKGMPSDVAREMQRRGGFWAALASVLPPLQSVAHLIRRSTSSGLYRTDTGEKLPGSIGLHVYLTIEDGTDTERFLRALHDRCWLAGLGWLMVGAGGQLLERSIVDRMVGAPERLVFEGAPILEPPLGQDRESRRPMVVSGGALDTVSACPPLTIIQTAKLRALRAKEVHRLAPQSAKARAAFVAEQAKRLAKRTGMSEQAAAQEIARQCEGVLLPDIALPFDDDDFTGCTAGDVLADPERFEGATLADPLEGVDYGRCKARIMRRADGTPWIHSFAHGRAVYELKHNNTSVRAAMDKAADNAVVQTFLALVPLADLDDQEIELLRNEAAKRSGLAKRTISQMLREAKQERAARRKREQRERRLAERDDPRPQIMVPDQDAPWLPQMDTINEPVAASTALHPTRRDIDNDASFTGQVAVPETHAFTSTGANSEEEIPTPFQRPSNGLPTGCAPTPPITPSHAGRGQGSLEATDPSQRGKERAPTEKERPESVEGAEPAKPTIKVHIIGTCPAETPCLHCRQTGNVKRITNASVVGGKSETLHEGCAAAWFAKL
jgi:hypothetical protein